MIGQPSALRPNAYADTSPAAMAPLHVPQFVIHGAADSTVPAAIGYDYAAKASAAGDAVTVTYPPGGHVEEIAPGTPSWEATAALVQRLTQ
jgi:pimeloyl-ACP methyl ester carboxylesterase